MKREVLLEYKIDLYLMRHEFWARSGMPSKTLGSLSCWGWLLAVGTTGLRLHCHWGAYRSLMSHNSQVMLVGETEGRVCILEKHRGDTVRKKIDFPFGFSAATSFPLLPPKNTHRDSGGHQIKIKRIRDMAADVPIPKNPNFLSLN